MFTICDLQNARSQAEHRQVTRERQARDFCQHFGDALAAQLQVARDAVQLLADKPEEVARTCSASRADTIRWEGVRAHTTATFVVGDTRVFVPLALSWDAAQNLQVAVGQKGVATFPTSGGTAPITGCVIQLVMAHFRYCYHVNEPAIV